MIVPWRVTKGNARSFVADLSAFDGIVLISSHLPDNGAPETLFSDQMRQETIHRLQMELDGDHHIWIASGRHTILYSFLHAQALSGREARVDFLCSVRWGYNWQTQCYEGFGEFILLVMLLEQRGIMSFHLPLALDVNATGMVASGWLTQDQGVYRKRAGGSLPPN